MCQEMPLYSVLCKEDIFIKADWQLEAVNFGCGGKIFVYLLLI